MTSGGLLVAVWLVAVFGANLPFVTRRVLGIWSVSGGKSIWVELLELVAMYFVVGAAALALEWRTGQIARQGWEFYAVTATMFLTLAFPGFLYRHLMRRVRDPEAP